MPMTPSHNMRIPADLWERVVTEAAERTAALHAHRPDARPITATAVVVEILDRWASQRQAGTLVGATSVERASGVAPG
jgi:hypothetical protein